MSEETQTKTVVMAVAMVDGMSTIHDLATVLQGLFYRNHTAHGTRGFFKLLQP